MNSALATFAECHMDSAVKQRRSRWRIFGAQAELEILDFWDQHRRNPTIHELENSETFRKVDKNQLKNKISNLLNKTLPSNRDKEDELKLLRKICTRVLTGQLRQ